MLLSWGYVLLMGKQLQDSYKWRVRLNFEAQPWGRLVHAIW